MSDRLRFPQRGMRRLKQLPVLPTLFTAGNLGCGVTAIMCAVNGDFITGCVLIFAAMVCDMLDGKMARMTGTEGEFGAELDSLADVVSFGVAPALLVYYLVLGESHAWIESRGVWFIALAYPIATAIRLARYNVEHADVATDYFKGLPSPGAAAVLCAWVVTYKEAAFPPGELLDVNFKRSILGMMVFLSFLMVSNVRFPHLGNTLLNNRMGFRKFLVFASCIYALVYYCGIYSLAIMTTGYLLYGFIPGMISALKSWKDGHSLLDDEDEDDQDDAKVEKDSQASA